MREPPVSEGTTKRAARRPPSISAPGDDPCRKGRAASASAAPSSTKVIVEAFKPGTAPPDGYSAVGYASPDGTPVSVSPEADRNVRAGTGLY